MNAQSSFPSDNAIWNVRVIWDNAFGNYYNWDLRVRNKTFSIKGDTLINGALYNKLMYEGKFCGGLKQENQKVWFRMFDTEYLLYDFGASVGDTVWHYMAISDEDIDCFPFPFDDAYSVIESIEIKDGVKYLYARAELNGIYHYETWVEGMGSLAGPFGHLPIRQCICEDRYSFSLGCFMHNDTIIYFDENNCSSCFDCPYFEPLDLNAVIGIYPNINPYCYETDPILIDLDAYTALPYQGLPPLAYQWSTNSEIYHIKDTISKHTTLNLLGDITIYLKIIDKRGDVAYDTLDIFMAPPQLSFSDNPQIDYYINSGDSIFLNGNVLALNSESTFSWSPCESIVSDCTVSDGIWVKPKSDTEYWLTAEYTLTSKNILSPKCSETFFTYFYKVHVNNGISNDDFLNNIVVYPNPTKDIINIEIPEYMKIKSINIYAMDGKLIEKREIYRQAILQLDISNLKTGTYVLFLESEQISYKKIVLKK
jgi:hypothetical protein